MDSADAVGLGLALVPGAPLMRLGIVSQAPRLVIEPIGPAVRRLLDEAGARVLRLATRLVVPVDARIADGGTDFFRTDQCIWHTLTARDGCDWLQGGPAALCPCARGPIRAGSPAELAQTAAHSRGGGWWIRLRMGFCCGSIHRGGVNQARPPRMVTVQSAFSISWW